MHFTIVTEDHRPQTMDVDLVLEVARALPGHWVIMNGPDAGATNPWHFHLQSFKADLPLSECALRGKRVDHPASIYRFDESDFVKRKVEAYLAFGPETRVNILAKDNAIYIVLRHTGCRTPLYKTGQPGYAEVGGTISTVTPEAHQQWREGGYGMYEKMMSDIAVPDALCRRFEALS